MTTFANDNVRDRDNLKLQGIRSPYTYNDLCRDLVHDPLDYGPQQYQKSRQLETYQGRVDRGNPRDPPEDSSENRLWRWRKGFSTLD